MISEKLVEKMTRDDQEGISHSQTLVRHLEDLSRVNGVPMSQGPHGGMHLGWESIAFLQNCDGDWWTQAYAVYRANFTQRVHLTDTGLSELQFLINIVEIPEDAVFGSQPQLL